jgi:hypothetical protein
VESTGLIYSINDYFNYKGLLQLCYLFENENDKICSESSFTESSLEIPILDLKSLPRIYFIVMGISSKESNYTLKWGNFLDFFQK